ncbi:hypothetical protein Pla52n_21040 [Stieleria varia]|uniref:Uncharacterized protein n=1 Tax=Stieleria varia TaxID=2528005 RepID=A0A5C6B2J8_9BACT|nr:hypothetical protein Pla52n_21040 [Stieleria varia]
MRHTVLVSRWRYPGYCISRNAIERADNKCREIHVAIIASRDIGNEIEHSFSKPTTKWLNNIAWGRGEASAPRVRSDSCGAATAYSMGCQPHVSASESAQMLRSSDSIKRLV